MKVYRSMPGTYDLDALLKTLPFEKLCSPIDAAGRAFTRADERIRRSTDLGEGILARNDLFDASASIALEGDLVHLEDLVLHDAGMDRRPPSHELTRAARLLHVRRRLSGQDPKKVLTASGIRTLIGDPGNDTGHDARIPGERVGEGFGEPSEARSGATELSGDAASGNRPSVPTDSEQEILAEIDRVLARSERLAKGLVSSAAERDRGRGAENPEMTGHSVEDDGLLWSRGDDRPEKIDRWLGVLEEARSRSLPEVLTAALLLDGWHMLQPLEGWPELGRFLAASQLTSEVTPNHLPALCVGLRKSPFRWRRRESLGARLAGLLGAFERAARETLEQMDRLQIARDRLDLACRSARKHSRMPEFAGMFLTHPLVTIPMARQELGVTAAAVDAMIRKLGPALPRELTGRGRYRAWGIL